MKSYLDLVRISAKVNKRQNRMSVFCIVLAVFLVTVVFGMADMFIQGQIMKARIEEGNWHVGVKNISDEEAELISVRPDVMSSSWYGILNYRGDEGYTLAGKKVSIVGSNADFITKMQTNVIQDGVFPQSDNEAMITENAKTMLGLNIGDQISIDIPNQTSIQVTISGFVTNFSKTMEEDSYAVCLTTKRFDSLYSEVANGESADHNSIFFVQFSPYCNIQKTISDLKSQLSLSDNQVMENTKLLGLLGQSGNSFMMQIYSSAAVLFLLILLAGVMMIASSLNSNVAQRTEFFGMMRCIGATPKQVMRFVRKEALGWCRLAIPLGVSMGIVIIWILCAMLRYLSPEYFIGMPVFGISLPSILTGIFVGILTVLLAARSPAKRAARVSPLVAVSGNVDAVNPVHRVTKTSFFKIDTLLGFHHAKASKKNFFLMVGSFSMSIILFLTFSVMVDFMKHAITPLKPWNPDLSIVSVDNTCSIDGDLLEKLKNNSVVKRAYGRMFAYDVPVTINGEEKKVNLISYEKNQFKWAKDYLLEGSVDTVQQESNTGLIVYEQQNVIRVGDVVNLNLKNQTKNMKVVGLLSSSPFNGDVGVGTIICSESTFRELTGQMGYTIIDLQLSKNATQADVDEIHKLVGTKFTFSDERLSKSSVIGAYYSFGLFIYGFIVLITLITIFNIVNSIAMSVSARMKQYGVFRAIGLSNKQLIKMIIAEASTYAIAGSVCGGIIGIILNKILYEMMVTFHWGEQWSIPFTEISIIIVIVFMSVILAIRGPVKRISKMSIVDTIG
jgi:putative ABC transport system permease protein